MYKLSLLVMLLVSATAFAQSNEKIKPGPLTLVDSETKWKYILDSSHKTVTAYNKDGDSTWAVSVVFPEMGNSKDTAELKWVCTETIWSIEITHDIIWVGKKKKQGEKIILIIYDSNCSAVCVGYIDLKLGKYHPRGCD